jgi:hypothetical protein
MGAQRDFWSNGRAVKRVSSRGTEVLAAMEWCSWSGVQGSAVWGISCGGRWRLLAPRYLGKTTAQT